MEEGLSPEEKEVQELLAECVKLAELSKWSEMIKSIREKDVERAISLREILINIQDSAVSLSKSVDRLINVKRTADELKFLLESLNSPDLAEDRKCSFLNMIQTAIKRAQVVHPSGKI